MNKLSPFLLFVLFFTSGCVTPAIKPNQSTQETQDSPSQNVTLTPQSLETQPLSPKVQLQFTYLRTYQDENYSEMYAVDINCITPTKICLGEPHLLFATKTKSDLQNEQPWGVIIDYAWSPDGKRVVLSAGGDIWIGDIDKATWMNLTNSEKSLEIYAEWLFDGSSIAFNSCVQDKDNVTRCELKRMGLAGEGVQVWDVPWTYHYYGLSSYEKKVVFLQATGDYDHYKLFLANMDGTNIQPIPGDEILGESTPSFSPNGKKVVFTRSESVASDKVSIVLKDLETQKELDLTKDLGDKFMLFLAPHAFSPDGQWIIVNAFDENRNPLTFFVSVDGSVLLPFENGEISAWRRFER